jgi:hypothetical protein
VVGLVGQRRSAGEERRPGRERAASHGRRRERQCRSVAKARALRFALGDPAASPCRDPLAPVLVDLEHVPDGLDAGQRLHSFQRALVQAHSISDSADKGAILAPYLPVCAARTSCRARATCGSSP